VGGDRADLETLYHGDATRIRKLRDLHFPVGGLRFRPTLEDVIEFVIHEEMVIPREGWEDAVKEHRARWTELQVKAAARRHPEHAAAALRACGWTVEPPDER
jgi:hypothetical protein